MSKESLVFPAESKVTCESGERKLFDLCVIKIWNIELQNNDTRCDEIVTVLKNVLKKLFEIDEITS